MAAPTSRVYWRSRPGRAPDAPRHEHVAPLVDHTPVRVERPSLVVDRVPERVERPPEANVDLPVHGQERRNELADARGTAGLVVVDDVPALALVPEIVVDEGLGLEHDLIADRGGDDETRADEVGPPGG